MAEILLDVTRLLKRLLDGRLPTGVDRVNLAYVRHYRQWAQALLRWDGRCCVLPRAESQRLFGLVLDTPERLRREAWPLLLKSVALSWQAPKPAAQLLFNTSHSGLEHAAYPALIRRLHAKPVFFVHDLIPLTHPEYCRPGEDQRHARRMDTVLDCAAAVVTNSHATLDSLADYARATGKPLPPAAVAGLAPGLIATAPATSPLPAPYFVMLGTIEPRKNHWLMLHLWRYLAERHGAAAPKLLIIGQRGWECENVADLLERCAALRGVVIELPNCADAEVVAYLRHAQALLFPSFAEGYGLPLVEALALGVPVIASDLPAFREIVGDIPEYIDPLDGRRWHEVIAEFSKPDSPLRTAQLQRLHGFQAPTWTRHFAVVDELLARVRGV